MAHGAILIRPGQHYHHHEEQEQEEKDWVRETKAKQEGRVARPRELAQGHVVAKPEHEGAIGTRWDEEETMKAVELPDACALGGCFKASQLVNMSAFGRGWAPRSTQFCCEEHAREHVSWSDLGGDERLQRFSCAVKDEERTNGTEDVELEWLRWQDTYHDDDERENTPARCMTYKDAVSGAHPAS